MRRLRQLRAHLGAPDAGAPAPQPVANDPGEYFVLDPENEAEALSACEDVCEGIVCQDWENDAVASIPGNAGDDDTWKCDCTCECDDDRGAGLREAAAQFRDN